MTLSDRLRRMSVAVYLAAAEGPLDDIAKGLREAADRLDALEAGLATARAGVIPTDAPQSADGRLLLNAYGRRVHDEAVKPLEAERDRSWKVVRDISWITHDDLPLAIKQTFEGVRQEAGQQAGPISSTERYDIELPWRRELAMSEMTAQNERELHAAWQKRAEQAEAERDALKAELERLERTVKFQEEKYLAEHEHWGECKFKSELAAANALADGGPKG